MKLCQPPTLQPRVTFRFEYHRSAANSHFFSFFLYTFVKGPRLSQFSVRATVLFSFRIHNATMADIGSYGGMDEESAEIKRLDAEVVSHSPLPRVIHRYLL